MTESEAVSLMLELKTLESHRQIYPSFSERDTQRAKRYREAISNVRKTESFVLVNKNELLERLQRVICFIK